jgi:hypothetical protein
VQKLNKNPAVASLLLTPDSDPPDDQTDWGGLQTGTGIAGLVYWLGKTISDAVGGNNSFTDHANCAAICVMLPTNARNENLRDKSHNVRAVLHDQGGTEMGSGNWDDGSYAHMSNREAFEGVTIGGKQIMLYCRQFENWSHNINRNVSLIVRYFPGP